MSTMGPTSRILEPLEQSLATRKPYSIKLITDVNQGKQEFRYTTINPTTVQGTDSFMSGKKKSSKTVVIICFHTCKTVLMKREKKN